MIRLLLLLFPLLALPFGPARADEYADTVKLFRGAGQSAKFFDTSYGYAVFPTIGKGGIVLGAAHGSGRVYVKGAHEFTSGNFELGAQASAVAITAGASAQATTGGAGAGASGTPSHANAASRYHGGMAIFTIAKGGLMYEASLGGQKFSYRAK